MTEIAPQLVLSAFVVFSRIGACLLIMPGFSSPRIPVQARLFLAIALSLAITPMLLDRLQPLVKDDTPVVLLRLMLSEGLIGALIGLLGRVFFLALETIAVAIAMAVGMSGVMGSAINGDESVPALSSLLTLSATALLFITDQHLEIFKALAASYTAWPALGGFPVRLALTQLVDACVTTFMLALRIGSPFLIFSVATNFAIGLTNRLVPTVQIFFLATPFLLIGGLYIMYVTISPVLRVFMTAFSHFLVNG